MGKAAKNSCFFLAFACLACGVIYGGSQYSAGHGVNWIVVRGIASVGAFLFIVAAVLPDIAGPAAGFESPVDIDALENADHLAGDDT